MFDNLVESTKHGKETARTGRFMLITSLIYVVALLTIAVGTIVYMNPNLVDALDVQSMLAPPPPPPAAPPPQQTVVVKNIPDVTTFTPPTKPPEKIPDPTTVQSKPAVS